MTDIFLAHVPEDGARVAPLADALRAAALDVRTDPAEDARLTAVIWSRAAIEGEGHAALLDQADRAKARGTYLGVKLDLVNLPFGFGGLELIDLTGAAPSALVEAAKARLSGQSTGYVELERLPEKVGKKRNVGLVAGIAAALLIVAGAVAFFMMGSRGPSAEDQLARQFTTIPCAWLGIDPVENGKSGTLALTGVAGDPAKAGETIRAFTKSAGLGIDKVTTDKIAQIDPRECAAIDAPIRLRKDLGGRLRVTGEPFILNTKVTPHQALVRVQIALRPQDKSMALLGIEPSGKVTWSLPDIAAIRELKNYDVGLVEQGEKAWEFTIYPDHLGWTGLLLVAGDSPLARKLEQGKVQNAGDFARTIAAATAKGQWDAEMVWFRIDPDPAG